MVSVGQRGAPIESAILQANAVVNTVSVRTTGAASSSNLEARLMDLEATQVYTTNL